QSAGQGQQRATAPEVSATDHEADKFAGELATNLRSARIDGRFNQLVLVAPPAFLGRLRSAMDSATSGLVVKEINKNLTAKSSRELEEEFQQQRLM
uniref:host attachment protein n=1 Tax=Pseudomaricurvus sp. TaxID=2004510 RepID=UPI003F6B4D12